MTHEIAESDWKHFRKLHPIALERFSTTILNEIETVSADVSKSSHQRYLDIYKIVERKDKELSALFNDIRRSTALVQIVSIYDHGLLTENELMGFSLEVVNFVKLFINGRHA